MTFQEFVSLTAMFGWIDRLADKGRAVTVTITKYRKVYLAVFDPKAGGITHEFPGFTEAAAWLRAEVEKPD